MNAHAWLMAAAICGAFLVGFVTGVWLIAWGDSVRERDNEVADYRRFSESIDRDVWQAQRDHPSMWGQPYDQEGE